jgi:hypothetical protein
MATENHTKFDRDVYQKKLIEQGYIPEQAKAIAEQYDKVQKRLNKKVELDSDSTSKSRALKRRVEDYIDEVLDDAGRAGGVGYMARALIQATMPHSRVEGSEFKRRNGRYHISILAPSDIGLPYGVLPRLIMLWATTEAVRTKHRVLSLGDNLSDFMRSLGLVPTGGRWGSITRIKTQMRKLLACSITCTYDDGKRFALEHVTPVEKAVLWWNPKDPKQQTLWESTLTLSERFFGEITTSPVPINIKTLEALRGSSMSLDIYCWLTYRNFYAQRSSRIPWEALQAQFGAGYPETLLGKRHFKSKFLEALKKVSIAYPEAQKLRAETDVLMYVPGFPDVAPSVPNESYSQWAVENKLGHA